MTDATPQYNILPEIWQELSGIGEWFPTFPDTCPSCGAAAIPTRGNWRSPVTYACGAGYTSKLQIQAHVDKWWGVKWWGVCTAPRADDHVTLPEPITIPSMLVRNLIDLEESVAHWSVVVHNHRIEVTIENKGLDKA